MFACSPGVSAGSKSTRPRPCAWDAVGPDGGNDKTIYDAADAEDMTQLPSSPRRKGEGTGWGVGGGGGSCTLCSFPFSGHGCEEKMTLWQLRAATNSVTKVVCPVVVCTE